MSETVERTEEKFCRVSHREREKELRAKKEKKSEKGTQPGKKRVHLKWREKCAKIRKREKDEGE